MTVTGAETVICVVAVLLFTLPVSPNRQRRSKCSESSCCVLVEENVTDCKAVWYWAGVAVPLKVSTPAA